MTNKLDLRVIKTNNTLYDALINLLKEKTFEEIKVSDICQKALVNRSTFYSHFNDKYELFISLINNLKQELESDLKLIEEDDLKNYYLKMIEVFLNHIEGKENIYRSILINNRNSIIMDMIYNTITEDVNSRNIVAILVDTKYLLTNWVRKNEDHINGIIQLIEENVGGISRE